VSGQLDDAVPDTVLAAFAANPTLLVAVVQELARRSGDGRVAHAARIMRGHHAGRRALDDERSLHDMRQLLYAGEATTVRQAARKVAATSPDLKLTRFRGHRTVWVQGVHDGQDKIALRT
jgi:hypothetical protein